jgi:hypothetical protein
MRALLAVSAALANAPQLLQRSMSKFQLPAIVCFVTGGCFNMTSSKIISEMSDLDKFPVFTLLCMVPNVNNERNKSRTRTSFPR